MRSDICQKGASRHGNQEDGRQRHCAKLSFFEGRTKGMLTAVFAQQMAQNSVSWNGLVASALSAIARALLEAIEEQREHAHGALRKDCETDADPGYEAAAAKSRRYKC